MNAIVILASVLFSVRSPSTVAHHTFDEVMHRPTQPRYLFRARFNTPGVVAVGDHGEVISCDRDTTGTYFAGGIMQTAAVDQCRVDDQGLLVERSTTNFQKYSNELSAANGWATSAVSVLLNQGIAPTGLQTLDQVTSTGTQGIVYLNGTTTSSAGPFVASAWARPSSGTAYEAVIGYCYSLSGPPTSCSCWRDDGGACTPVIIGNYCGAVAQISTLTRIAAVYTCTVSSANRGMAFHDGLYGTTYGAVGLFGAAQLELASIPSSYMSTTSATAPRVADLNTVTIPLTGLPRWNVSIEASTYGCRPWNADGYYSLFSIGTAGAANSVAVGILDGSVIFDAWDSAGTNRRWYASPALTGGCGTKHKIAVDYTYTLGKIAVDGVLMPTYYRTTVAFAGFSSVPTAAKIGVVSGGDEWGGYISDLRAQKRLLTLGARVGDVALLGDSITLSSATDRTPYSVRLNHLRVGGSATIANYGVSGNRTDQILTRWTSTIRSTLPSSVVILAGVNDIFQSYTAEAAWANIKTMTDQALADGASVVLLTVMPCYNFAGWSDAKETQRLLLRDSIIAYDVTLGVTVVDLEAAFGDGGSPNALAAAYDSGDHLHPNQDGLNALAAWVDAALP